MEIATLATISGIAVLLVLSAFFSSSETALTAASRPRMHLLEAKGDKRAKLVNRLRSEPDNMIGTILLGNNLVNILASALATSVLISLFGETGVVYATIAMTLLVLIFGEILPKTYAFRHSDKLALTIAPTFLVLVRLLSPVMSALQYVIRGVQRIFGVKFDGAQEWSATVEELRGAIELHRGRGAMAGHERAMLHSILDLADVDVEMVMQHRRDIFMIDSSLPTSKIVEEALESPFTRIPLWRDTPDNIVGVMHAKAMLREVHAHTGDLDALDLDNIATPPWFIPESTTLLDQLHAFRRRREHFALVVDEYGALMGVVTLEDILEEIVGDISDEHDVVPIGVRPQRDGSYLIAGGVTVRDLNRRFGWDLPDQEAATIAGLVIHESKVIPQVGQIFHFHGFRFQIARRQRNRITSVRMTKIGDIEEDAAG
ncbi:MAG: HlyC/CorC family transporter [Alphaproteobacteria bacterium]|nr:HlyC/CorC family transporter [Alphaproteobacteria bacterium]